MSASSSLCMGLDIFNAMTHGILKALLGMGNMCPLVKAELAPQRHRGLGAGPGSVGGSELGTSPPPGAAGPPTPTSQEV